MWIRNHRTHLIAMLLLALLLRTWVAVTSTHVPVMDESGYDETGWSIASGQGYVMNGTWTYKAPLYSAFIGAVYGLKGERDYRAVRITQAVLSATLCLLVVWLGQMVFSSQVGLLAGWITALYPAFVVSTQLLRSEVLVVWFVTACSALWVWAGRAPAWWKSSSVGALAGLSALVRAAALGLPVVLAGATLMCWRTATPKKRIAHAVLIVLCAAVAVAPWTIRNWIKVGEFVPISTEGGRAFYVSWVSLPDGKRLGFGILDEQMQKKVAELGEVEAERFLYASTFAYLRDNPREVVRLTVLKTLFFFSPFEWELMSDGEAVYNGAYVAAVPFLLLFLFRGLRSASREVYALGLVAIYFASVSTVYTGLPRFRFPIEPLLILAAAAGMVLAVDQSPSPLPSPPRSGGEGARSAGEGAKVRVIVCAIAAWAALNVAVMPFSSEIKPIARTLAEKAGLW